MTNSSASSVRAYHVTDGGRDFYVVATEGYGWVPGTYPSHETAFAAGKAWDEKVNVPHELRDPNCDFYPPLPTLERLQQREGSGWHSVTWQTGAGIVTVRVNEDGDVAVTRNGRENRWPAHRAI